MSSSGSALGVFASGLFHFLTPAPAPGPVDVGPALASAPVLLWSTPLPGPAPESAVRSEPGPVVVDGDRLYVGASSVHALLILDRRDGRLLMELPAKGAVVSAPIVTPDRVWFSDDAGYTWSYARPTAIPDSPYAPAPEAVWSHYSGAPIVSSPTLDGGTLFVANVDEQVYALDAASGSLRWRHAHRLDPTRGASLELFGAPSPAVAGPLVYAGFSDGFLVAIATATGEEQWRTGVGEGTYPDLIAPPLALGDAVLTGGFSEPLVAVDPLTRVSRWRVDAGTSATLTVADGKVWQGGADGVLRRIDPRTGAVELTWTCPEGGTLTQPVVTPAGVLVGTSVGGLYLVDAATGLETWEFDGGSLLTGVTGRPAVDGDTVYFVSNAGNLYGLRGRAPATGTPGSWLPASRAYRTTPADRRSP